MHIDEIKQQKWEIHNDLKVETTRISNLQAVEQELHLNHCKVGYDNPKEPETLIDCSYQRWITHLAKSEVFILKIVLISIHEQNNGYVLAVKGALKKSGFSLNKKIRKKMPSRDVEALRERARLMRMKRLTNIRKKER